MSLREAPARPDGKAGDNGWSSLPSLQRKIEPSVAGEVYLGEKEKIKLNRWTCISPSICFWREILSRRELSWLVRWKLMRSFISWWGGSFSSQSLTWNNNCWWAPLTCILWNGFQKKSEVCQKLRCVHHLVSYFICVLLVGGVQWVFRAFSLKTAPWERWDWAKTVKLWARKIRAEEKIWNLLWSLCVRTLRPTLHWSYYRSHSAAETTCRAETRDLPSLTSSIPLGAVCLILRSRAIMTADGRKRKWVVSLRWGSAEATESLSHLQLIEAVNV